MIVALQTLVYFRQSLFGVLEKLLLPYYEKFASSFGRLGSDGEEEDDDQVYAEFDDEKGVVFFPPMYLQRYAAVSDCLMDERWCGQLEKVVDLGHHDMSFIKYLKEVPGIRCIIGVDIESIPLRCSSDLLGCEDYAPKRESPLKVTLFQGNAADPDYRLIGTDAVVAIEMIEHMLPHDLDRMVHTVFGFIKPWVAVFTTPNADFNVLFKSMEKNGLRRWDHFFEWTREQFHDWCSNIVTRYPQYTVTCKGIGPGPPGTLHYGCCSQLALFVNKDYQKQHELNPNSLAMVATAPSDNTIKDMMAGWESPNDQNNLALYESGLNCSTYQVKKFSPTAQNLMAKYKQDSLIHTREVVSEIRHLTNMLNFGSDSDIHGQNGKHIWHNFNWGENAPYWNQYYKIVREFNYPFETKSEESRIIDLITEEINKLTETPYEDECSTDMNKVEIPMQHLMKVVSHITHDVEKVKDLLEWNGYEVVGNMVIHSRLVVGNASVTTGAEEWPDNDTVTDLDTSDVMSFSEASTIVPDCNGRALRHALDAKVRKLRAMVSADEDITTELDKVVCRLMKLALRTCKARTCAPPSKWMQFKLLDLLTLTEKTIARRKQHCVQGLKAIGFVSDESKCIENASLSKFKNDNTAAEILDKYKNILSFSDIDISREQFLDNTIEKTYIEEKKVIINNEIKLERTQAWVEEKNVVHIVNYPFQNETLENSQEIVSVKRSEAKQRYGENEIRRSSKKKPKYGDKKKSETKLKKVLPTKSSSNSFVKRYKRCLASHERRRNDLKSQKRIKDHQILQSKASNPIPGSIIDLCHPELRSQKNIEYPFKDKVSMNMESDKDGNIAATEESLLVDIVMDDTEETIALRRTIGTDAEISSICREQEAILNSVINASKFHHSDDVQPDTLNFDSQNIFIYDINEPSTSKGVRHVSMDVQCGTDPIPPSHAMPSPASSLTKMPALFTSGIKIEDSKTNFLKMDDSDTPPKGLTRAKSPSVFSKGIKIGDSTTNIPMKKNSSNFGASVSEEELPGLLHSNVKGIKIEDSLTNMRKRRSLDSCGTMKNSEKSTNKTEQIPCFGNVFDFKKPKMNEQNLGARTYSKTEIANTTETWTEQYKAGIPKPKSLKFFPEVKDKELSDIKTHEYNFDYKTFIDNNYTRKTTTKKSCSFSTSTEDIDRNCKSAPPIWYHSVGVKIKDSDTNFQSKVDCQTETLDELLSMPLPSPAPLKCTFAMETKLIKSIGSSSKMEDSCSELNESSVSVKSPSLCPNYVSEEERNLSPTKHLNLSRGGIHVHSYREKQISEDVMYQGEWQRHKPRINARKAANKKAIDSALKKRRVSSKEKIQSRKVENKKLTEPVPRKRRANSKERGPSKRLDKKFDSKTEQSKPVQVRRPKVEKPKENNLKKTEPTTKKNFLRRDVTKMSVQPRGIPKVASKIAVSSISSKTKNTLVVKRASAMVSTVVNIDDDKKEKRLINYIPRYLLRRKIREAQQSNFSDFIKTNKSQANIELGEIQKQLTDFDPDSLNSTSYVVFRNEIEGMNSTDTDNQVANSVKETKTRSKERNHIGKRTGSPASQNSSTCSTSDSIATVKAVTTRSKVCTKKHSTPSSRSGINSESDSNNTPDKNKKSAKKPATKKGDENKENIPEPSDKLISLKNIKSVFIGRNKSVFMALNPAESATKQKEQGYRKSNIKIPVVEDKNEKKICDSPTMAKSSSYSLEREEHQIQEDVSNFSQITDILDQSFDLGSVPHLEYSADSTVLHEISNNTVSTEWYDSSRNSVVSTQSTVQTAMRRIVEDSVELALRTPTFTEVPNTETFCCEHCRRTYEGTVSPISYKTTVQENFNSTLVNELENALNKSFDFDTPAEGASTVSFAQSFISDNTDMFSFKSSSEYYLADDTSDNEPKPSNAEMKSLNEKVEPATKDHSIANKVDSVADKVDSVIGKVDSVIDKIDSDLYNVESVVAELEPSATNVGIVGDKEESVHGLFERKEPLMLENPGGSLAIQAFSGFSMDTNRLAGDQPDYVNLIDSETGSYAVGINRQATSEEVFVSGRSSESFQSCLVDEDAVVPNWLFNLMQQQRSITDQEEDEELILPMAVSMPIAEPVFDLNGNATEATVGVGAGAGDGRGIHSDNSQDSSGRGTSMSSSDSSSGAHSEAILIDPSAFTAQFELLQESVASSTAVTAIVLPSSTESLNALQRIEDSSNEAVSTSRGRNDTASNRRNGRGYHTSDVDADVSSIDDLPDSSDN